MRTDNDEFAAINNYASKEYCLVVAVSFEFDGTDLVHFTSSASAATPPGAIVIASTVADIGGTTQKINPDTANATIGSISFKLVDLAGAVTTKIYDKLASLKGLNGKRVQFYIGAPSLVWDDYVLFQTQIIKDVSLQSGGYRFSCSDVQRTMRNYIFDLAETALSASIDDIQTSINVYDTTGFEVLEHAANYGDSPSAEVGYIKIENGDKFEIIEWTGKTSTSFTGLTRGALQTKPLAFETTPGSDNGTKVEEYVYLEMPAPKMIYALLTGKLYGQPGKELPTKWHLAIDEQYVRTADFLLFGNDYWDTSNDSLGLQVRFTGSKKIDGKRFIEKELLLLMGAFSPVYSNGELGLKRLNSVLDVDSTELKLDESNVISHGSLNHDLKSIKNRYLIHWNKSASKEEFTRRAYFYDPVSQAAHGVSDLVELSFQGLHGSKHSHDSIQGRFDALRDRYAGPPLKISVKCKPSLNVLEVGDLVYLDLPKLKDFNTDLPLSRAFEVQQASIDFDSGSVSLELFGSSQKATTATPNESGVAVSDAWYSSEGADIETAFSAETSRVGDVVTLNSNIDLTAGATLTHNDSIYYVTGDFIIADGVTVTVNDSVQLRVKGFLTVNGSIDGVGRGPAGGAGVSVYPGNPWDTEGVRGFIGSGLTPQGSINCYEVSGKKYIRAWGFNDSFFNPQGLVGGAIPVLNLSFVGGGIRGLPVRLDGSGGTGGCGAFTSNYGGSLGLALVANGGGGGDGGAGLCVVCRGMEFGVDGSVNLGGGDSDQAQQLYSAGYNAWAGAGSGGHPGALLVILDGVASNPPSINGNTFFANYGESKHKGNYVPDPTSVNNSDFEYSDSLIGAYYPRVLVDGSEYCNSILPGRSKPSGSIPATARVDVSQEKWLSCYRIQFITGEFTPVEDEPSEADRPITLVLNELLNTPPTAAGDKSTVEITVTPPSDANYSYAIIDYRESTESGWSVVGAADDETIKTLDSNGKTYIFRARAVSKYDQISQEGITNQITLNDISDTGSDIPTALPVPDVTGLALVEGGSTFGGDANATWTKTSNYVLSPFSSGTLDLYFKHFKVQVLDPNNGFSLIREEIVLDNHYAYTLQKNSTDYELINAAPGSYQSIKIQVKQVSVYDEESVNWVGITVNDPVPPDLDGFLYYEQTDGTREFTFIYTSKPFDWVGYELRYKIGSYSDWGTMDPLHLGLITSSPWENNQLPAGTFTFAAKPIDRAGRYSANALFITTELGDPRQSGSIVVVDANDLGWPGTKTNCEVNGNGKLRAADQNDWTDLTTWAAWDSWAQNPFPTIIYEHAAIDLGAVSKSRPVISAFGVGTITVEESHSDDNVTYTSWAAPNSEITFRYIKTKITVVNNSGLAVLETLLINLTGRTITDHQEDLDTSLLSGPGGDVRIPLNKTFIVIKRVTVMTQNTGGGYTVDIIDKNPTLGPRIKIYDETKTLHDATIDVTIEGL